MSSTTETTETTAPAPPQCHEVADDVHAYVQADSSWWINNTVSSSAQPWPIGWCRQR